MSKSIVTTALQKAILSIPFYGFGLGFGVYCSHSFRDFQFHFMDSVEAAVGWELPDHHFQFHFMDSRGLLGGVARAC